MCNPIYSTLKSRLSSSLLEVRTEGQNRASEIKEFCKSSSGCTLRVWALYFKKRFLFLFFLSDVVG